jgi:flagellar motor switch protein FliN
MTTYFDAWIQVATALFSQALAGEPTFEEDLPRPLAPGAFAYQTTISGDESGRFAVVLDAGLLEAPLFGEGADQKASWGEVLQETFQAACGELLAKTGKKCKVESFGESGPESKVSRAFRLAAGERSWTILVRDEVCEPKPAAAPPKPAKPAVAAEAPPPPPSAAPPERESKGLTAGVELLLDVELEACLRFGCREMPLGEVIDLGPGDVVQLDRHVSDPVDLVVGDKIVAKGEVVLVNGNFGLRVTEVAAPRKRLESIRCLF